MPDNNPSNARLKALAERLRRVLADQPPPGAVVRFDLGDNGCLMVDAHRTPPMISTEPGPADCTLAMGLDTLERVLTGGAAGRAAFMQGEMTISGDVELAVRLNELLARGDGSPPPG